MFGSYSALHSTSFYKVELVIFNYVHSDSTDEVKSSFLNVILTLLICALNLIVMLHSCIIIEVLSGSGHLVDMYYISTE